MVALRSGDLPSWPCGSSCGFFISFIAVTSEPFIMFLLWEWDVALFSCLLSWSRSHQEASDPEKILLEDMGSSASFHEL